MFRFGWLYSATAYNHAYTDSGLFCIHASAEPQYVRDMVKVIVFEIANMANNIQREEFAVCQNFNYLYLWLKYVLNNFLESKETIAVFIAYEFGIPSYCI